MTKHENNLSQGNVAKQLISFSIPFLISNLIQTLYNVVDMLVVGRYCGTVSISGVNIGSQLTLNITNFVVGLSMGGTVLIGQYFGAGKRDRIKETVSTLFSSLLICAVVLTLVVLLFCDPILNLINTPTESYSEAKDYLIVTGLGTIFIFAYNALSAVMRGMGDSKRPLYFVAVTCVINIIFDILFVGAFGMKSFGAALATVISQAISVLLCAYYLSRSGFVFDFKLSSFKINNKRLKELLKIGIPSSIQNVIVGISFLILTALINNISVEASAAVGVVAKFNGFAILPALAISSSISAMCSHNFGAGLVDRARKTLKIGSIFAFCICAVMLVVAQLLPRQILLLFDSDPVMIENGITYMRAFSTEYVFVPFVFCFNGFFIGAGKSIISLIISSLSAILIRVPVAIILGVVLNWGLLGIGLGSPVSSVVSMIVAFLVYKSNIWLKNPSFNATQNN